MMMMMMTTVMKSWPWRTSLALEQDRLTRLRTCTSASWSRLPCLLLLGLATLVLLPVVSWMQHRGSLNEVAGALCLLQRLDLVFKMLVLPLQVLNVTAVTAVFPPHKGNILACLFEDLSPAALVPLPGL